MISGTHFFLMVIWIIIGVLDIIARDYIDSAPCFLLAVYYYRFATGEIVVWK